MRAVQITAEVGGEGFQNGIFSAKLFVDFLVEAQKAAMSNLPPAVTMEYPYNAFLQKMALPVGARVAVFGDMHGSLHSMLRELKTLRGMAAADGPVLGDNLELRDKNFYIVMCGDYVDRGINGPELLALILLLRHKNPSRVVLVRGCVRAPARRARSSPIPVVALIRPPSLFLLLPYRRRRAATTRISRKTIITKMTRIRLRSFSLARASSAKVRARTRWPYRSRIKKMRCNL